MLTELPPSDYQKAAPILGSDCLSLEARSIVCGNSPGRVFLDSVSDPCIALVWSDGIEGFYLAGASGANFEGVEQTIARVTGPAGAELSACSRELDAELPHRFSNSTSEREMGLIYFLSEANLSKTLHSPRDDSAILTIDEDLLQKAWSKSSFLRRKVERFWKDPETFLKLGGGACAVQGSEVVSVGLSGFVADGTEGIDVESQGAYQRRGLGRSVARKFISGCTARGRAVQWGCMEGNRASINVATGLGFQLETSYTLLTIRTE